MSPASAGTLEVEKYIGACLITQQRPKNQQYYHHHQGYYNCRSVEGWAGGVPLISFANQQKRKEGCTTVGNPLQGAPLILTKTFNRKKNQKKNYDKTKSADTVSVTSDESSGSTNSETCLPRIIKPRKRRKKERKPTRNGDNLGDLSSPEVDPQQSAFVFEQESETPQLHHSFDEVQELVEDVDFNGNESLCQCRYCDPSGQIWDVERRCYSPFLTTPSPKKSFFDSLLAGYVEEECLVRGMSSISLSDEKERRDVRSSGGDLEVSTEIVTSLNGHRDLEIKFFTAGGGGKGRTCRGYAVEE